MATGVRLAILENEVLRVAVAPAVGGRVVSLIHRATGREFLWRNPRLLLAPCEAGSAYDPNFYGGIDEVIPCDSPETIDGVACPDHGELWTLPLSEAWADGTLTLRGRLPLFGLTYERRMSLVQDMLVCQYRITNPGTEERRFMWKFHAALAISPGDRIVCPAATACVADPEWSRRKSCDPFAWPDADGLDMSVVPRIDGTTEYLLLYDLADGRMALEGRDGARLECRFDKAVFPCCVYFASHGALNESVTAVLEPCTTMPVSVNEAAVRGICSRLGAGEVMETTVRWMVSV